MSLAEVDAFAGKLPNVALGKKWNRNTWLVNDRGFCWERPLGKADLARLGDATPPSGEIIAVAVENLDAKDALLAMELPGFFTIEHFNGYPAVLVELRLAQPRDVRVAIEAAWRATSAKPAPRKRAKKPRKRPQR
jgi:hypothetical protein